MLHKDFVGQKLIKLLFFENEIWKNETTSDEELAKVEGFWLHCSTEGTSEVISSVISFTFPGIWLFNNENFI